VLASMEVMDVGGGTCGLLKCFPKVGGGGGARRRRTIGGRAIFLVANPLLEKSRVRSGQKNIFRPTRGSGEGKEEFSWMSLSTFNWHLSVHKIR